MTQPTTLDKTFDTSLVDVQRSFSSTETNTSGSSAKENMQPPNQPRGPSPFKEVSTDELYDQWASTYDTDGNVLQAVDDIQMQQLLPQFVELTCRTERAGNTQQALRVLDMGCGTGRITIKLLKANWDRNVNVTGWDGSRAMLEISRTKCDAATKSQTSNLGLGFEQMDLASVGAVPQHYSNSFDGLISTLVLEHIAADTFFGIIAKVLRPGCYALITNMHQDMGAVSRAGFKTASGERYKGTSYIHTVQSTVDAAEKAGFEVMGNARELAVDQKMIDAGIVDGTVAERARKWVGIKIWYGVMVRKK